MTRIFAWWVLLLSCLSCFAVDPAYRGNGYAVTNINASHLQGLFPLVNKTHVGFFGDSLTDGVGGHLYSYATFFTNEYMLPDNVNDIFMLGGAGQTAAQHLANYHTYMDSHVPGGGINTVVFYWGGWNDLFNSGNGINPTNVYVTVSNIWYNIRAQGCTVVAFTLPFGNYASNAAPLYSFTNRAVFNGLVRASAANWDYLVDAEQVTADWLWDRADQIHLDTNACIQVALEAARVTTGGKVGSLLSGRQVKLGANLANDNLTNVSLFYSTGVPQAVAGKSYNETNSGCITVDQTAMQLYDGNCSLSLDWGNKDGARVLVSSSGDTVLDWNSARLKIGATTTVLDWLNGTLNWGGGTILDWAQKKAYYASGELSVDWQNGTLSDSSSVLSVDYGGRVLKDGMNFSSVNWGSRTLNDTAGATVASWGTTGFSVAFGDKYFGNAGGLTNITVSLIQTNFVSGQLYANNYGSNITVSATVILTAAGVAGDAAMDLWIYGVAGGTTNRVAEQTLVTTLAATNTAGMVGYVPAGATWTFTNRSAGTGDSSAILSGSGMIKYP